MFKVIYTKTLDNADDIVAESWEYDNLDLAITLFNERVKKLLDEILGNEFIKSKISVHKHKAIIKMESTHYCLAVVDDLNKGV